MEKTSDFIQSNRFQSKNTPYITLQRDIFLTHWGERAIRELAMPPSFQAAWLQYRLEPQGESVIYITDVRSNSDFTSVEDQV